jgi:hypothetical protein
MEYSAKTTLPLNSIGITYPLSLFRHLSDWYTLSLIFILSMGEKILKGSQMSPFLVINTKGGESISPKQKDRTTTKILKEVFQIGTLMCLIFFN